VGQFSRRTRAQDLRVKGWGIALLVWLNVALLVVRRSRGACGSSTGGAGTLGRRGLSDSLVRRRCLFRG